MPGDSALNWYSRKLVQQLSANDIAVSILSSRSGQTEKQWFDNGVQVIPTFRRGNTSFIEIGSALIQQKPRTLHVQHELFAYGGLLSAYAVPQILRIARRLGTRVITTFHGLPSTSDVTSDFVKANGLFAPVPAVQIALRTLGMQISKASDQLIVHNNTQSRLLQEEYETPRTKINIIPIGTEAAYDRLPQHEARGYLNLPVDAQVLCFFGHLSPYKGLSSLIPAVEKWLDDRSNRYFILAGDMPEKYRSSYSIAAKHKRILRLGFIPDESIAHVLGASDLLVLPYTQNVAASGPFSIALSHRIPILVSDVISEDCGLSISCRPTPEDINASVNRYFEDTAFRSKLQDDCEVVRNARSWQSVAEKTIRVYEKVM